MKDVITTLDIFLRVLQLIATIGGFAFFLWRAGVTVGSVRTALTHTTESVTKLEGKVELLTSQVSELVGAMNATSAIKVKSAFAKP